MRDAPPIGHGVDPLDFPFFTLYRASMKSRVSSKGQVTVPAEVRNKLGLSPGTVVVFELQEKGALLRKGGSSRHPVDRVFGTLKLAKPTDILLDEMRGPRPRR